MPALMARPARASGTTDGAGREPSQGPFSVHDTQACTTGPPNRWTLPHQPKSAIGAATGGDGPE